MKKLIRVLTVGVFDLFHVGHINLFIESKKYGNYLIVAVQDKPEKYKSNVKFHYCLKERIKIIKNLRLVNRVVIYNDIDDLVKKIEFDVFAKGPDQKHQGFQNAIAYCKKKNIKVVVIPRTKEVSSTTIRNLYS